MGLGFWAISVLLQGDADEKDGYDRSVPLFSITKPQTRKQESLFVLILEAVAVR
jgi:hypothetical protein